MSTVSSVLTTLPSVTGGQCSDFGIGPLRREGRCSQVDCVNLTHRQLDCKCVKLTALSQSGSRPSCAHLTVVNLT